MIKSNKSHIGFEDTKCPMGVETVLLRVARLPVVFGGLCIDDPVNSRETNIVFEPIWPYYNSNHVRIFKHVRISMYNNNNSMFE